MRCGDEGMMIVRAELCERVAGLRTLSGRRGAAEFRTRLADIRGLALAYGLTPAVRLADALDRAVAQGGADVQFRASDLYLDRLDDAIGCEVLDERSSQALLASVSVRLSA
jgi:hypothetical protein